MRLLIKNIRTLVQTGDVPFTVAGSDMKKLPCIHNAWLAIENDRISAYGSMYEFPGISDWTGLEVIDATDRLVFPCWCDSHTHLVYAGSREGEFADRISGLSYEEIAKRGGGILNSADKLRKASEQELIDSALPRLNAMMRQGTGAVEIKSGYGLTTDAELKMLRVIKKLKSLSPLSIKATFLGAHAVPREYAGQKDKYVELVIKEMLPQVASEQLADYCDVFCERNYFTKEDTMRILTAAYDLGLKGKVHAEQLSHEGGAEAGALCRAISVDHLEYLEDRDIELLKQSGTMPTLLPGAQWFLQLPFPPARKMIDAGLPVAIATDHNPGSCPSGNMNFMLSLACVQYKMTPEEVINAATVNSACAMDLSSTHGSITVGKQASIFITREIPHYSFLPYSFANDLIETVIINGSITYSTH
jgi:imidazolonepropionase